MTKTEVVIVNGDGDGDDTAAARNNNNNGNNNNNNGDNNNNNNSAHAVAATTTTAVVKSDGGGAHVTVERAKKMYKTTPLPMRQMMPMTFVLLNESLCMNMLQPFVGLLVARLQNRPAEEAGYMAGTLISVFMLGQVLSARTWGWLSDQYGRRLPLITGLFTSGMAILLFGLSTSIWVTLVARFLHGLFNGNILVAKTMMADITDRTNEARGFAFVSFCGAIGLLLGPALGGLLYDPAASPTLQWLHVGPDSLLGSRPALLPCCVVTCYSFVGVLVCTFFVQESNPKAKPLPMLLRYLMPCFLRPAEPFVRAPLQEANVAAAVAATATTATAAATPAVAAGASGVAVAVEDARVADAYAQEEIADFASVSFCASFFDGQQLVLQPCREHSTYDIDNDDDDDDEEGSSSDDDDDSLSYSDVELRALHDGRVAPVDEHNTVTAATMTTTPAAAVTTTTTATAAQRASPQRASPASATAPPRAAGVVVVETTMDMAKTSSNDDGDGVLVVVRARGGDEARQQQQQQPQEQPQHGSGNNDAAPHTPAAHVARRFGYKQAFQRQQTRHMLVSYMLLSGGDVILKQCLSLWAIATVSVGGLSYGSDTVGYLLLINSVPLFVANYAFHWAFARYTNKIGLFRLGLLCNALVVFLLPYTHYVHARVVQFLLIVVLMGVQQFFMSWCYSLNTLLTARAAPAGHVGSIMGINQSCAASTRGIVPFFVTPLFAWSITGQHVYPFNFALVFVLSSALYMLCWVTEYNIRSDAAGELHMVNGQLTLTRLRRVVRRITR